VYKNVEKNVYRIKIAKSLSLCLIFSENICLILRTNDVAIYLIMWLFYCALPNET
jgi:hypothetical protein